MDKRSSQPKVITKKHMARLERERRQIRLIRGIAIGGIIVVALLLLYGYLQLNVLSERQAVAEVNGERITTGQWQERVRLERVSLYNQLSQYQYFQQAFGMDTSQQQQEIQLTLTSTDTMGERMLNTMIDEALIRQEAKVRGISVSADEVEKYIQEAYQFYPDGSPTPTVTPTEFAYPTLSAQQLTLYPSTATPTSLATSTPDLTATPTATATIAPPTPTAVPEMATVSPTPYTLDVFKENFQGTLDQFKEYGISEKTLRTVYEMQLLRNKLMEDEQKDLPAADTQVLARHILVDTEAEALAIVELLNRGEDFAEVAQERSKDTGSGQRGGDLGWAPASNYVPEFAEAVRTQEIGEIGAPVKTEFGYHIIQVIAREELPLTASQFEQKKQTAFSEWLQSVHDAAEINIYEIWKTRVPTEPVLGQQ